MYGHIDQDMDMEMSHGPPSWGIIQQSAQILTINNYSKRQFDLIVML